MTITPEKSGTYYVCIDKNQDGDYTDFGEFAFNDLVIIEPEPQKEKVNITEQTTEINETKVINETEKTSIAGGIIGELKERISGTDSLFVLLEITLLLMLFVLILILLRLRRPTSRNLVEKEYKEESETEDIEKTDKKPRKRTIRKTETNETEESE